MYIQNIAINQGTFPAFSSTGFARTRQGTYLAPINTNWRLGGATSQTMKNYFNKPFVS
jgi:hypothetical protein